MSGRGEGSIRHDWRVYLANPLHYVASEHVTGKVGRNANGALEASVGSPGEETDLQDPLPEGDQEKRGVCHACSACVVGRAHG